MTTILERCNISCEIIMPRKIKKGLEFYKKDVDFYNDIRIVELIQNYGPVGCLVYEMLLSEIFKQGYFLEMKEKTLASVITRMVGNRWLKNVGNTLDIFHFLCESSLIDRKLLDKGIVTSRAIQEQYHQVTSRSKADKSRYWIVREEDFFEPDEAQFAAKTPQSAAKTPEKTANSTQEERSKNKEEREKNKEVRSKSKKPEKGIKEARENRKELRGKSEDPEKTNKGREGGTIDKNGAVPPTISDVKEFCKGKSVDPQRFFNYYEIRGWRLPSGQAIANWRLLVEYWEKSEKAAKKESTYDINPLESLNVFDLKY